MCDGVQVGIGGGGPSLDEDAVDNNEEKEASPKDDGDTKPREASNPLPLEEVASITVAHTVARCIHTNCWV